MDVWIVIPVYNEERRIVPTLDDYLKTVAKRYVGTHLLAVSDSTDRTDDIISTYSSRHREVILLRNGEKKGKGFAIFNGFKYACRKARRGSIIGFVDADDAVDGNEIVKMVEGIGVGRLDGIVASRYAKGSVNVGKVGISRWIASRAYNRLVRALFGLKFSDTQCGAKFFRKEALEKVLPNISLFDVSIDLNLLYELKRSGASIGEMSIRYVNKSDSSMKVVLPLRSAQMLMVAISFRIMRSRLSFLLPSGLRSAAYKLIAGW